MWRKCIYLHILINKKIMYQTEEIRRTGDFIIVEVDTQKIIARCYAKEFDTFEECEDMANHICNLLNQQ